LGRERELPRLKTTQEKGGYITGLVEERVFEHMHGWKGALKVVEAGGGPKIARGRKESCR
jgi:hypothetical protein